MNSGEITVRIADLPEVQAVLKQASDKLFLAKVELENVRKMLADQRAMTDAANEREQIQLKIAVEAIKERNSSRNTMARRFDLLVEVQKALLCVVTDSAWMRRQSIYGPQDPGGVNACYEAVDAEINPRPTPMCADPLDQVFPDSDEGRPT